MLTRWLPDAVRDLRYSLRVAWRTPVFAAVAILSLALGIGGAASVFTVLNAVVLRTLPVPNPQQLFVVNKKTPFGDTTLVSWPWFQQARQEFSGRAELFASTGATGMQLRRGGSATAAPAERGNVQLVSGEFFQGLGQQPQAGRLLSPSDNENLAAHPVAVISDRYWDRQFNRSHDAIGRELVINGTSFTIVGVARPGFFGAFLTVTNPDVWIPLLMQPAVRYSANASSSNANTGEPWPPQAGIEWLTVFARLPGGMDPASIASPMTVLVQRDVLERFTDAPEDVRQRVTQQTVVLESAAGGVSGLRDNLTTPLYVLLAMVGVLVAIACGNLASLLLARANARDREISIRLALGAGRARVVRQLLAETMLLAVVGGALGLLAATWGRDALLSMFAPAAVTLDLDTRFDVRVLAFVVSLTSLTGMVAGLIPALRGSRTALVDGLKLQGRLHGASPRGTLVGKALVAAQMAFCLVLLVVAALFVRSLRSIMAIDVGYDRSRVLAARLDVRGLGYSTEQRQALYNRVIDAVKALPAVESVSLSANGPLANSRRTSSLGVEGYTPAEGERLQTNEEVVTEDYFSTVGLHLVEGRLFGPEDRSPGSRATVINQTMARRFFEGRGALGKRWNYGGDLDPEAYVIVGVVEDARYTELRTAPPNMAYRLSAAASDEMLSNLEVRTRVPPSQLAATVRAAINQAVPALPVFDIVTLEQRMTRGASNERLIANLSTAFGTIALLLAAIGLYGTISYSVSRRVSELGVRMALGAARTNVLWLVMREALLVVVAGSAVGFVLALFAARSLRSLLYTVPPIDPVAFGAGVAVLLGIAGAAAWLPAHRASRIDPMTALRKE